MLTTLRIKNLALVDDLTLEPGPGYNVVTGETGAGKSILIGALKLVLGERADRTLLRAGCESCTVEAVFDVRRVDARLSGFLEENGLEPCEDDQLVLKRVFTAAGSNRQFINGSPTPLATLAALGEWLVDIHGPHDHQSLLHTARQLEMLDAHAGLGALRTDFAGRVRNHQEALSEKRALITDDATYARQLDLLRFQVQEIHAAGLVAGEEEQLEADHARAANAARLLELGHAAVEQFTENEMSLLSQAGQVTRLLQELARLDPATAPFLQQHEQAMESLGDLAGNLSSYLDRVEIDPDRFRALEERLNLIQSLKRKYGSSAAGIVEFGREAQARLAALEQRDEQLGRIEERIAQTRAELCRLGRTLSEARHRAVPKFRREVEHQLRALGFAASHLDVVLASDVPAEPGAVSNPGISGFDRAEFSFAPNPGEPPRPLRAIASSGELARVMLALKTVLASEDRIPVLVFDEVDANVGGETAQAVGQRMKQIADGRQVFCITHLPQVAAPAQTHYVVSKHTVKGRTVSRITPVTGPERVGELARMLGGESPAARQHAKSILAGSSS